MKCINSFSQRLRLALEKRMWTQRQLAEYCKIQEGLISKYLKDIHTPSKKTSLLICAGLDISPQWLLNNIGSIDDHFNIAEYSNLEQPKVTIDKSHLGGFDLTVSLSEDELKKVLREAIKYF